MFDLIITGGTAVMPASTESGRYRGFGREDRRDRRARQSGGGRGRADGRCGGADRYPRRDRSAYPLRHADRRRAVERADLCGAAVAGQQGGAVWRHDDDARFRAVPAGRAAAAIDRGAATRMGGGLLYRLRVSPDAARHADAGTARRLARGGAGRARDGENLHDRYQAAQSGPHGQVRRYLGSVEDHGARGRASRRSTPRTTTSSCTCTKSCSARSGPASRTWPRSITR